MIAPDLPAQTTNKDPINTEMIKTFLARQRRNLILRKIAPFREIDGWLTDNEAYGLYNIATKTRPGAIVIEIGSWKGKSTYCIAKGTRSGTIYAIDPFNADGENESKEAYQAKKGPTPPLEQFTGKMSELGVLGRIKPMKGYSREFIHAVPPMDFLFIDGDHSIEGCKYDFEQYSPLLKAGGFLAFHDYYPDREDLGPTWVIHNLVTPSDRFHFFRKYDSLWVGRKNT